MNIARLVRLRPMPFYGLRPQIRSLHASRALSRQKVNDAIENRILDWAFTDSVQHDDHSGEERGGRTVYYQLLMFPKHTQSPNEFGH